jgi:LPXTG-site transpeptidase (sortase) family protein
MRRTALVLIAALASGAGAGFFVHVGAARPSAVPAGAAPVSPERMLSQLLPEPRRATTTRPAAKAGPATISIPRLHLKSRIYPALELNSGPAWWPVTGRPGRGDTVAIAGHRTTHTHPFYYLDRLRPGDAIYVVFRGQAYRYRVTTTRVIPATDEHMADAVGHERLLLTACTPRGSAAFRLVVQALPD